MTPALEVCGLSFAFGGRTVFEDLSFRVAPGESVGIAGANGAGKSTLLWCVLGLHRARGTVRLFGAKPDRKTLGRCGVVFQNPEDQLFLPSILDDIALGPANRGARREEAREAALVSLRRVGLEQHADRPAGQLSLGQRKRAAIALALAGAPELLILDEPTAELDGRSVRELAATLNSLSVAKLVASHDLGFLGRVVTRLIVLEHARIAADGPAAQVLADTPALERAGLI